jgi:hypothetical protein
MQSWRKSLNSDWRDYPGWLRAFMIVRSIAMVLGTTIFFLSWAAIFVIDARAFRQPVTAIAQYQYPEEIKGHTYFLTATQDRIYAWANPAVFGAGALMFFFSAVGIALERRQREKNEGRSRGT